ncbi:MAG: restriction endonuclease subunit S [Bacilli bacterium]|nr:restriction endonuclease subunit S [Bacilli bacterium]
MSRVLVDSGVSWLGKIPDSWSTCRVKNKFLFHKIIAKERSVNYDRIALTLNGVIKRDKDDSNGLQPDNYNGYQVVYKDDLIFKLIDLENVNTSRIGKSEYEGITSPAYIVLTDKCNTRYSLYYFLNMWYQEIFNNIGGDGVRSAINKDDLLKVPFINAPIDEQNKIADYLDKQCKKINEIINDNNHEIELLEEYKRTILKSELGNNVSSKKYRIKNIANLKGRIGWQGLTTADYIEEGPYLITGVDFNESKGSINWESCVHISEERYEEAPEIHVLSNDLLITKDGTIGKLAIISENREASLNSGVMLIRIKDKSVCNVKYLYYLLKSDYFWDWYNSSQRGSSTIKHLYQEQFYNFSFFLPDLAHQEKVIKKIDDQFFKLDQVIKYRKQIIEKLEEYKKSLIYECVTGKREV